MGLGMWVKVKRNEQKEWEKERKPLEIIKKKRALVFKIRIIFRIKKIKRVKKKYNKKIKKFLVG